MSRLLPIALACCLALAACGQDDDEDGAADRAPAPATADDRGADGTDPGPDATAEDGGRERSGPPPGFGRYRERSGALRRTGAQFALELQICLTQGTKPKRLARCFREAGGEFRQQYSRHDELVAELAAAAGPGRCRDRLKAVRRRATSWRDAFREGQDAGVAFGRAAAGDGDRAAASPRLAKAIDAIAATGRAAGASGDRAARDCR